MFDSVKAKKLFEKLKRTTRDDTKRIRGLFSKDSTEIEVELNLIQFKYDRYVTAFQAAHQVDNHEKMLEAHINSITRPIQKDRVLN